MQVTYPIYVLERDDFSFREFSSPEHLDFCERMDVLERLYNGWDSTGRHFTVVWDERRNTPTVVAAEETSLGEFSDAVEHYATLYGAAQTLPSSPRRSKYYDYCDPAFLRSRLHPIQQQTRDY